MTAILASFARHRIAPNVLMFVILLLGLWSLERLNVQFLPDLNLNLLQVSVEFEGASAQDVQRGITIALENTLSGNADIDTLRSRSLAGRMEMDIALREDVADPDRALRDIERALSTAQLPSGVDTPEVVPFVFFERVADVLLYGDLTLGELRYWVDRAEQSLSRAGIARVQVAGLPQQEWVLEVSAQQLLAQGVTVGTLAEQLAATNIDVPAGVSGAGTQSVQWRFDQQRERIVELEEMAIRTQQGLLPLGALGTLRQGYVDDEMRLWFEQQPAVRLSLSRASGEDTLAVAQRLDTWTQAFTAELPPGVQMQVYNEDWRFVQSRIGIILDSGLGGMLLVLLVLFVFLNHRVAFWVALGIPISFLGTLVLMELSGNTINLISLLGFLVALGIIVDDAIVVGEQTYAQVEQGVAPADAAVTAARRMLPAVLASSVTTIAAFLPLLLVSGQAGTFTISVPLVVIFAILASLIECFLILPGHLAHSLKQRTAQSPRQWWPRRQFERGFNWFRQHPFRRLVQFAVAQRLTTYSIALVLLVWSLMLVVSGRVNFVFFPDIQQEQVTLEVDFAEGTPVAEVQSFLNEMDLALRQLDAELPFKLVQLTVQELYRGAPERGALFVSFADATDRPMSNDEVLRQWRERVVAPAGIVGLRFTQPEQGPSTNQVNVRLRADDPADLQRASLWLQQQLRGFGGLRDVGDNMPLGGETLSLRLRSEALSLGLSAPMLAQQVADLTQGRTAQVIQRERDELHIMVRLPQAETRSWVDLQQIPIILEGGLWQPLSALVTLDVRQVTQQLNRVNGELSAEVTAALGQPGLLLRDVNGWLRSEVLPELETRFPVAASLEGDEAGQTQFLRDVQFGAVLGLVLIFGALAWVFESWLWPFAVLSAIPFALTGAVAGHWIMGIELTVLSVYGLFGLAGIVINNGIVLVLFYRDLLRSGLSVQEAVVEASVQRFRAVVLTTLTTVAGLSFLLFERSFDAQFLIPVAVGIVFGLLFGTIVMLVLVPALLTTMETWRERWQRLRARPLP